MSGGHAAARSAQSVANALSGAKTQILRQVIRNRDPEHTELPDVPPLFPASLSLDSGGHSRAGGKDKPSAL